MLSSHHVTFISVIGMFFRMDLQEEFPEPQNFPSADGDAQRAGQIGHEPGGVEHGRSCPSLTGNPLQTCHILPPHLRIRNQFMSYYNCNYREMIVPVRYSNILLCMSDLFHEVNHVTLVRKHNHHASCGFPYHVHDSPQLWPVHAPGQHFQVGETTSA